MRKNLTLLVWAILAAGCAEQIEFTESTTVPEDPETTIEIGGTRALTDAVYNEIVDAWIAPHADPYTLENFQSAYNDLATKKSTQTLTRAQAAEFTPEKELSPTHYALKIYPKNEDEQRQIENMEDVQVAYIPFDWVQLTPEETEIVTRTKTRSAATTFAEKSPYTVTYDDYQTTDGGPTGPVTFQLPILYTVWPVDKPFPSDLEYEVDYEIFLPYATTSEVSLSEDAIKLLEGEALSISTGESFNTRASTRATLWTWTLKGSLSTYDDLLAKYVPLVNLRARYQDGSAIVDAVTDSDGNFVIQLQIPMIPYVGQDVFIQGIMTYTYLDPQNQWKITTENSTVPYSVSYTTRFSSLIHPGMAHTTCREAWIRLPAGNRQVNEIHRAVEYFYGDASPRGIPRFHISHRLNTVPIQIIAEDSSHPNANGVFSYDPNYNNDPRITIYNNGNSKSLVIGTTLHEIGHFMHYWGAIIHPTNKNIFVDAHDLLRESAASFFGWNYGEEYYLDNGRTQYSKGADITGQGRQYWSETINDWYTPLFIDLMDDYNQWYIQDDFSSLSTFQIWNIISDCKDWAGCRQRIQHYVTNGWFANTNINMYLNYYDYWFNTFD